MSDLSLPFESSTFRSTGFTMNIEGPLSSPRNAKCLLRSPLP
jgi:hypothetical protein